MIDDKNPKSRGFTLVELSIVLVIVGLLVAGALSAYGVYVQKRQVDITKENIEKVNDAIAAFQQENGFLPCPADPAQPAAAATDCNDETATATMPRIETTEDRTGLAATGAFSDRLWVRIGVVPITVEDKDGVLRQLVPGENAVDGWRNRLAYAVVEQSAIDEAAYTAAGDGAIQITDNLDTPSDIDATAKYIVLSHGEDGAGAYSTAGIPKAACNTTAVDGENCDNDDLVFTSIGVAGIRSTAGGDANFDDFVLGDTRSSVPITCRAGQVMVGFNPRTRMPVCATTDETRCMTPGEAFVGMYFQRTSTTTGEGKFVAQCRSFKSPCPAGEVLALTDATADTKSLDLKDQKNNPNLGTNTPKCIKNTPSSCPAGYVQGGSRQFTDNVNDAGAEIPDGKDDYTKEPISEFAFGKPHCVAIMRTCPSGYVQVGVSSGQDNSTGKDADGTPQAAGQPLCAPRGPGDRCRDNTVMVGINADGSSNCAPLPSGGCSGNGQVVIGLTNGQPYCGSAIAGGGCGPNGAISSIDANGHITCKDIPSGNGLVGPMYHRGYYGSGYGRGVNALCDPDNKGCYIAFSEAICQDGYQHYLANDSIPAEILAGAGSLSDEFVNILRTSTREGDAAADFIQRRGPGAAWGGSDNKVYPTVTTVCLRSDRSYEGFTGPLGRVIWDAIPEGFDSPNGGTSGI